jgi:cytoskeleton protein RodZ
MNESDIVDKKENKQTYIALGEQLQAARIQQGLSIEDIASRMHLSLGILQSIEANDFDDLTAPIFVKGYLRAYARLVSLDEDEIIQRYVEQYSNDDPPISASIQMTPETSAYDSRIKWTTYLIIIVLIALLSFWWWNKTQNILETVSLDTYQYSDGATTEQITEPEIIEVLVESDEVIDNASSEPLLEETSNLEAVDTVPVENFPAESAMEEAEAEELEPEVTADTITAVDAYAVTTEDTINVATGLPFDIARAAPTGVDLLHITVNAVSWADIKDANNHKLIYGLLNADLSIQIKGKAPFDVLLGNGHGVEISFNSRSIDVIGHTLDDNTARLKIGTN